MNNTLFIITQLCSSLVKLYFFMIIKNKPYQNYQFKKIENSENLKNKTKKKITKINFLNKNKKK